MFDFSVIMIQNLIMNKKFIYVIREVRTSFVFTSMFSNNLIML